MSEEGRWRRRSRGVWIVHGAGVALSLGSLLMTVWDNGEGRIVQWEGLVRVARVLAGAWSSSGWTSDVFVTDGLASIGVLLSFVLLLPGFVLLWFACRSRLYQWLGFLLWSLLVLIGPVLSTLRIVEQARVYGDPLDVIGVGFWAWCLGVVLIWSSFTMAPRRPLTTAAEEGAK